MKGKIFLAILFLIPAMIFAYEPMPKPKSSNPEAQKLIDQAWALVKKDMTIKNLDRAIQLLEKANQIDPNNHSILVELADYYWQRGDLMPEETKEDYKAREKYFLKGKAYAEQALKIKESPGAYYWYSANLASSHEHKSIFSQVRIFPTLKKNVDWILEKDPNYFYGGAARFWSKVVAKVPTQVMKLVGQDPDEIKLLLEQAIKSYPKYLLNYVYKAMFCWKLGEKEEALKALDYALKQDPNIFPEEVAKNRLAQRTARKLWKEYTGKEYPER